MQTANAATVNTFDLDRGRILKNFPLANRMGYDSRKMGALALDDFIKLGSVPGVFFSEREIKGNRPEIIRNELTKYFRFLDSNGDGLISPLDTDERGMIDEFARWHGMAHQRVDSGKPYGSSGSEKMPDIRAKTVKYVAGKLKRIGKSRKLQKIAGKTLYSYNVPVLYLDKAQEGITILHLSDIHFGKKDGEKIQFLQALQNAFPTPDFVMITGDFVSKSMSDLSEQALRALSDFFPGSRRLFVPGNHDYVAQPEINLMLADAGYSDFTNKRLEFEIKGAPFTVTGLADSSMGSPRLDVLPREKRLAPNVLMAHNLDALHDGFPGYFDLVLSGHTHGGEVNLFFVDGFYFLKRSGFINRNRQKEEWKVLTPRTSSYVSPGAGSHFMRFNALAEGATLLRLCAE